MRHLRLKTVLAISFFTIFSIMPFAPALAQAQTCLQSKLKISQIELEQRGKDLRSQLEDVYKKSVEPVFNVNARQSFDVTSTVGQYIPVGISFEDAKAILHAAGFKVYPGPWSKYASDGSDYLASIDPFEQGLLWRTELIVLLAPNSKNKYDFVCGESGFFSFATL